MRWQGKVFVTTFSTARFPGITAARVVCGERISGRARKLMEDMGLQAVPSLSARDQATALWLCVLLQSFGPMPTTQVLALAERALI